MRLKGRGKEAQRGTCWGNVEKTSKSLITKDKKNRNSGGEKKGKPKEKDIRKRNKKPPNGLGG